MKLLITLLPVLATVTAVAAVRPKATEAPVDSYSDSTRALNQATADGAAKTKVGGSTLLQDPAAAGGTGSTAKVQPTVDGVPPGQEARTASDELRTGTASTGGTGTRLNDAGEGSTSNTTGTGSMGSDSGRSR